MTSHPERVKHEGNVDEEWLFAVAVKRGDQIWDGGKGSHSTLRRNLDPACADPYNTVPGDIDGFIVAPNGRFVDREEAKQIAEKAGQCAVGMRRELLSADITWDPPPSSTKG